jgi:hypothetical protein
MTIEDTSIAIAAPAAGQTDTNIIEGEARAVATPVDGEVKPDGEAKPDAEAKPEKTAEQREIDRLRRGIDRRTRQLAEARAQSAHQPRQQESTNPADDSEPLSFTRAQIQEMVTAEARKLAPTLREEAAEGERRQGVVDSLAKTWGAERFDEVASELDDIFGGLTDRSGRPKPAIEAVFESDSPAEVIEWLTDPDNIDEAERISRLSAAQAGRAIARLEDTLKAAKAAGKPKASKAPAPLEAVRGQGSVTGAPNPSDTKAWINWRNEQERKGL